MENLAIALSLAEHGFSVFPCNQDGLPLVKFKTMSTRSAATIRKRGWFQADERIGINMGKSGKHGLIAVDVDNKNGKNGFASLEAAGITLPETFTYKSRSGKGAHYLYHAPEGMDVSNGTDVASPHGETMPGVDLRAGTGAMVVYAGTALTSPPRLAQAPKWACKPPSQHAHHSTANLYTWLDEERNPRLSIRAQKLISAIPTRGASNGDLLPLLTPIVNTLMWGDGRKRGYRIALERYTRYYSASRGDFEQAWSKAISRVEDEWAAVLSDCPSAPAPGTKIHHSGQSPTPAAGDPLGTAYTYGDVTFTSLEHATIKAAEWAWGGEGIGGIPIGGLTIVTGKPGDGKSTMCRWLAAEITQGTLQGTWQGTPHNVLYLSAEESLSHMVVPSLLANGAAMQRVLVPAMDIHPTEDMDSVIALCKAQNIRAVFVDPLSSYMAGVDTHRNSELRDALKAWSRLAEEIDGAVIAIVHQTKSGGSDFVSGINGSSAYGEVARAVLATAVDAENGTRVVSQGKNSLGPLMASREFMLEIKTFRADDGRPKTSPRFVLGSETTMSAGEIFNRNKKVDRGDTQTAKSWLRDYLTTNPGSFKVDIVQAAKGLHSERAVELASQELNVKRSFENRKVIWNLD